MFVDPISLLSEGQTTRAPLNSCESCIVIGRQIVRFVVQHIIHAIETSKVWSDMYTIVYYIHLSQSSPSDSRNERATLDVQNIGVISIHTREFA